MVKNLAELRNQPVTQLLDARQARLRGFGAFSRARSNDFFRGILCTRSSTPMFPAEATGLVVALSGGADSAALLAAAAARGTNFRGLPLRAVHIDHGLQAAAAAFRDACARPVRRIARSADDHFHRRRSAGRRIARGGGARCALCGARRGACGPASVC